VEHATVINVNGRDELIVSFPEQIRAFDPKTGTELWCAMV